MKIAVLVSTGRHPVSGTSRYSRNDAAALTIAIGRAQGAQLDVLHVGDPGNLALAEYLALGVPKVEVLNTDGDACAGLAQRLAGYDLVFAGTRAEGAWDSGTLPYRLADALNLPLVGSVVDVSVGKDGVEVRQFMPKGLRCRGARRFRRSSPCIRSPTRCRATRMRACAKGTSRRSRRRRPSTRNARPGASARLRPSRKNSLRPRSVPATRGCFRQRPRKAVAAAS